MNIYLDHAASTAPARSVLEKIQAELARDFANPASVHSAGLAAAARIKEQIRLMAGLLGCQEKELILTSGGSESINTVLKGVMLGQSQGQRRLIISQGEHSAVRESALWLEKQGVTVEYLPLAQDGNVDLAALALALEKPAALVSLIHVNNETGAVNPLAEIKSLRDRLQPRTLLHFDTVQTYGKIPFDFAASGVDFVSGSGHKLGAPKGVGWLIKSARAGLEPLIHGGGQQNGLRSGTQSQLLARMLALALGEGLGDLAGKSQKVKALSERLLAGLAGLAYKVLSPAGSVPHILNIAFAGLRGETLVNALAAEGVYISAGSACSARRPQSRILPAMGHDAATVSQAVRISFSAHNTAAEIDLAAAAIRRALQQYSR